MTSQHSTEQTNLVLPQILAPLVDAHTHINYCHATTPDQVHHLVQQAHSVGVYQLVTVADDLESAHWVTQAINWDDHLFGAIALHPTQAHHLTDSAKCELEILAQHERIVAIGETGLDSYWIDKDPQCADLVTQQEAFAWHINLAKRLRKPVMIHNRQADREVLEVLQDFSDLPPVIFHCFSSDAAMAQLCVERGWILSISGTVSFKNAKQLHQAVTHIPLHQLLVETDAPFLCPHPHRGKQNHPVYLPYTVRALAEILQIDSSELASITTENARRVFQLPDVTSIL